MHIISMINLIFQYTFTIFFFILSSCTSNNNNGRPRETTLLFKKQMQVNKSYPNDNINVIRGNAKIIMNNNYYKKTLSQNIDNNNVKKYLTTYNKMINTNVDENFFDVNIHAIYKQNENFSMNQLVSKNKGLNVFNLNKYFVYGNIVTVKNLAKQNKIAYSKDLVSDFQQYYQELNQNNVNKVKSTKIKIELKSNESENFRDKYINEQLAWNEIYHTNSNEIFQEEYIASNVEIN